MTIQKRQLSLFDEVEADAQDSSEFNPQAGIDWVIENFQEEPIWGIRRGDINRLRDDEIEDAYTALPNLDIPEEMLDILNTDEILTRYVAAGNLKRYNGHQHLSRDFYSLNEELSNNANRRTWGMREKAEKRFDPEAYPLSDRLSRVSNEAQERFLTSFFSEYIPINDPYVDVITSPEARRPRKLYIDGIYGNLESKWNRYKGK